MVDHALRSGVVDALLQVGRVYSWPFKASTRPKAKAPVASVRSHLMALCIILCIIEVFPFCSDINGRFGIMRSSLLVFAGHVLCD